MERMEIRGRCGVAIAYAKVIEEEAVEQIRRMCDYEFTEGASIRIMPDVHWGKGCTIGTTMTVRDKVVPNLVGVDIGCGMYTVNLGKGEIDLVRFDEAAHFVPSGRGALGGAAGEIRPPRAALLSQSQGYKAHCAQPRHARRRQSLHRDRPQPFHRKVKNGCPDNLNEKCVKRTPVDMREVLFAFDMMREERRGGELCWREERPLNSFYGVIRRNSVHSRKKEK